MYTPQAVSAADAADAIARIRKRREGIDDPQRWRLADDAAEVLAYLRKYSAGIPDEVARADLEDGLVLRWRLWWLGEEAELWLLEMARRRRMPLAKVAPLFGLASRQAVHGRLQMLRRKLAEAAGRPEPLRPRDRDEHEAAGEWLAEHAGEVLAAAAAVVEHRALGDESVQEWLDDVAHDVDAGVVTPGVVQVLRFGADDLASSPGALAAAPDHPVHAALDGWHQLYDRYQLATKPTRARARRGPPS